MEDHCLEIRSVDSPATLRFSDFYCRHSNPTEYGFTISYASLAFNGTATCYGFDSSPAELFAEMAAEWQH